MSSEPSDPLATLAQRIPLKGAKRRTRISIPGSAFTTEKRILVGESRPPRPSYVSSGRRLSSSAHATSSKASLSMTARLRASSDFGTRTQTGTGHDLPDNNDVSLSRAASTTCETERGFPSPLISANGRSSRTRSPASRPVRPMSLRTSQSYGRSMLGTPSAGMSHSSLNLRFNVIVRRDRLDAACLLSARKAKRQRQERSSDGHRAGSVPHEHPAPRDPREDGGHRLRIGHRDGHEGEPHDEETQSRVSERTFHRPRLILLPLRVTILPFSHSPRTQRTYGSSYRRLRKEGRPP